MFAALNSFLTGALAKVTDVYWPFVSMLLHGDGTNAAQNNTFLDGSTNNFTVTRNGNTTQGSFNPFVATYPYAVATNGGSGYFDGTGDYLTVPDSTAFTLGTNDFTVEAWVYATTAAQGAICGQTNAAYATANTSIVFSRLSDGRIDFFAAYNSGSSLQPITTLTAPLNTWTHVAAVRDGATLRVYVGGVQSATATISTGVVNDSASLFAIGRPGDFAGQYFPGYISNFRLVNGTCLYPSGTTFTPPTAPLTAVTNTALLLGMSNGAIFDNTMLNNLETVADAQISTSVFKYGTGSMKFDGTGDTLPTPAKTAFALGSGDFTIECWVNSAFAGNGGVAGQRDPGGNASLSSFYMLGIGTSLQCAILSGATKYEIVVTMTPNVWSHVAFVRDGATTRVYINGVQQGTAAVSTAVVNTSIYPVQLGTTGDTAFFYNGYIDDFRFTKGICRYPSGTTFTPPTAAFPNSGGVQLVDYAVVAGGGGGGSDTVATSYGGGGGAGGYKTSSAMPLLIGTTYTITVGAGGAVATSGSTSTLTGSTTVSCTGGGAGGASKGPGGVPAGTNGSTGGSGGGGGNNNSSASSTTGGTGTSGQGFAGGLGSSNAGVGYGGGGGGAGGVGADGNVNYPGGAGVTYVGTGLTYSTGGDGRWTSTGTANTGNGGGAASAGAGAGGSGVVVFRTTAATAAATSTTGSPTITVSGGYRIYTFTASGTITF